MLLLVSVYFVVFVTMVEKLVVRKNRIRNDHKFSIITLLLSCDRMLFELFLIFRMIYNLFALKGMFVFFLHDKRTKITILITSALFL